MTISISWTKSWTSSDDGTYLHGADMGQIQSDITTALLNGSTLNTGNTWTGAQSFTGTTSFVGNATFAGTFVTTVAAQTTANSVVTTALNTYCFIVNSSFPLTVVPTAGATYTNNSITFTVTSASATNIYATCTTEAPGATSGSLVKATGTGDATITFSNAVGVLPPVDGSQLLNLPTGAIQGGTVTTSSAFTIYNLIPGKKYQLILDFTWNTTTGYLKAQFGAGSADTGNNYNWASAGVGYYGTGVAFISMGPNSTYTTTATYPYTADVIITPYPGVLTSVKMNGTMGNFSSSNWYSTTFGGSYTGASSVTSLTLTPSAGTITGTWALYQMN